MVNKRYWLIILVVVLGMLIIGCNGGGGDDEKWSITISGTPMIGETITATSTGDFKGFFTWEFSAVGSQSGWTYDNNGSGGNNWQWIELYPGRGEGKYIRAYRLTADEGNKIHSNILGPIQ